RRVRSGAGAREAGGGLRGGGRALEGLAGAVGAVPGREGLRRVGEVGAVRTRVGVLAAGHQRSALISWIVMEPHARMAARRRAKAVRSVRPVQVCTSSS